MCGLWTLEMWRVTNKNLNTTSHLFRDSSHSRNIIDFTHDNNCFSNFQRFEWFDACMCGCAKWKTVKHFSCTYFVYDYLWFLALNPNLFFFFLFF